MSRCRNEESKYASDTLRHGTIVQKGLVQKEEQMFIGCNVPRVITPNVGSWWGNRMVIRVAMTQRNVPLGTFLLHQVTIDYRFSEKL